jgi:hypothetical protein
MAWEQKGENKGIWTELVNTVTGESSIKEHQTRVVWKSCKFPDHEFEVTGNREYSCKKCNYKFIPIIGIHSLVDGKIVEKTPPSLVK